MRRMQPQYAGAAPAVAAAGAPPAWMETSQNPFKGVGWTPSFIAFLIFIVGITTTRLTLGTAAMSVALLTLPLEKRELKFPPVAMLTLAFLGWAVLGLSMTDYFDSVTTGITEMTKVFLITVVAVNVISNRARMRVLFLLVLIGFCVYPMRGTILNYRAGITTDGRVAWNNIYANANDLAGLCLLQLSYALGALEVEKNKLIKLFMWFMVIALPIIVLITQSRGATVAMIVFFMVLFRNHYRDVRKVMGGIAVLGLVLAFAPKKVWDRLSSMQNIQTVRDEDVDLTDGATSSTAQRLEIWRVAWSVFEDDPVTGVGLGAYPDAHWQKAHDSEFAGIARGRRDAHSTYLKLLAELGIVGLGIFISIVVVTLKASWKARKSAPKELHAPMMQLLYMEIGLYAFLVAGIWGSYGALGPTYLHFALIAVAVQLLNDDVKKLRTGPVRPRMRGGRHQFGGQLAGVQG